MFQALAQVFLDHVYRATEVLRNLLVAELVAMGQYDGSPTIRAQLRQHLEQAFFDLLHVDVRPECGHHGKLLRGKRIIHIEFALPAPLALGVLPNDIGGKPGGLRIASASGICSILK